MESGEPRTTSNLIAKEFNISHREIVRKIKKLSVEISTVVCNKMFKESRYVNSYNRTFDNFSINRDGYMFLVMNIGTRGANQKKIEFIDAFNQMEQWILNQQNTEWVLSREQGKQARIAMTDTVKEFIEYAKEQGASDGAKFYYANLTKATYKALELLQHAKPKTRDILDKLQLAQLVVAENSIKLLIAHEMQKETHYREIYVLCKIKLEEISKSFCISIEPTYKILNQ